MVSRSRKDSTDLVLNSFFNFCLVSVIFSVNFSTACPKKIHKFIIIYLCSENRKITKFCVICQTEIRVAEGGMKWSTETRAFYL